MIAIDHVLLSDEVLQEKFVCDLAKCKGACCVDGDAGAPLEKDELKMIDKVYDKVKPYLNAESIAEIEKQGLYVYHKEFGWVTPAINGAICVYGIKDKNGVVKCGVEQAFYDNKIKWKKPVSCHLFPIIVKKSKNSTTEYVNYEPREDHCKPGCTLGKKLKVPVYEFLKEPLIRKFGKKFYEALSAAAIHLNSKK
ncbi:MAG: DUF3109 family protein [Chitinophagaceae bacterium]|jgi:hypothetical protein|nr:DUF3109 family protein [Chitinophagaceae bacterium]MBP6047534.1 DUF3109 family protein [Ferruginibacter sp.]NMD28593.1 DUF3109 family protein [Bacteroidota bacterium]MBK7087427.1 DUF3109 family protein [Chitinophagaceae bacterium]MBK7346212.1 DUF3109 family protein [Chitinophagaceae bacterium]